MADTVRSWLNEYGDASLIQLRWRLLLDVPLSQTAAKLLLDMSLSQTAAKLLLDMSLSQIAAKLLLDMSHSQTAAKLLLDMSLSQTAAMHCLLLLWLLRQGVASYRSLFRERSSPKGYFGQTFASSPSRPGHPPVVRPFVRRVNRPWLLSSSNMPLADVLFRSDTSQSKIDWVKGPSDVQTR